MKDKSLSIANGKTQQDYRRDTDVHEQVAQQQAPSAHKGQHDVQGAATLALSNNSLCARYATVDEPVHCFALSGGRK